MNNEGILYGIESSQPESQARWTLPRSDERCGGVWTHCVGRRDVGAGDKKEYDCLEHETNYRVDTKSGER